MSFNNRFEVSEIKTNKSIDLEKFKPYENNEIPSVELPTGIKEL